MHLPWEVVRRFPEVAHRLWVPEDDGRCFFLCDWNVIKSNPPNKSNLPNNGPDEIDQCENFSAANGKNAAAFARGSCWSVRKDKGELMNATWPS